MPEARSAEQAVVAGMLFGGVSVIDEVCGSLTERHFVDPIARELFVAVRTYRAVASGVLTSTALADLSRDGASDAGTAALLVETYAALAAVPVDASDTRWAAARVRSDRERADTAAALSDAAEIAAGSVTDPDGKRWAGPTQAREWAAARFAEIEADAAGAEALGADVRTEATDILNSYAAAHAVRNSGVPDRRPRFGVPSLDEVCDGLGAGELCIIAAPVGVGKTHVCTSLMHHAVVMQGLHVFFATSETLRTAVRARLVARHSRCEWFAEARETARAPHGLNSKDLERGRLEPSQVRLLNTVVRDLCEDPAGRGYGRAHIAQVAHGATVRSISSQASAADRTAPVDLSIIDYLALLSPERRRADKRTEHSDVLIDAKRFATTFRQCTGVPVVSPWQLSRNAQEEMVRSGAVALRGLAETSETEQSADTVVVLAEDGAREQQRFQGLRAYVLKNRDGEVRVGDDALPMRIDYATSYITDRASADSAHSENGSTDLADLDALLTDYA